MRKNQLESRKAIILEKLEEIRDLMSDLRDEAEETLNEIEPYEGKDDLTPAQEERQDWFDSQREALDNAIDDIDNIVSNLE